MNIHDPEQHVKSILVERCEDGFVVRGGSSRYGEGDIQNAGRSFKLQVAR